MGTLPPPEMLLTQPCQGGRRSWPFKCHSPCIDVDLHSGCTNIGSLQGSYSQASLSRNVSRRCRIDLATCQEQSEYASSRCVYWPTKRGRSSDSSLLHNYAKHAAGDLLARSSGRQSFSCPRSHLLTIVRPRLAMYCCEMKFWHCGPFPGDVKYLRQICLKAFKNTVRSSGALCTSLRGPFYLLQPAFCRFQRDLPPPCRLLPTTRIPPPPVQTPGSPFNESGERYLSSIQRHLTRGILPGEACRAFP
jgi:hypothetical protein